MTQGLWKLEPDPSPGKLQANLYLVTFCITGTNIGDFLHNMTKR